MKIDDEEETTAEPRKARRENTRAKLRLVAKGKNNGGGEQQLEWRTGWQLGLLVDKDGKPTGSPANVAHTLRHSPDWQDVLWFDAFAVVVITKKRPPFLEPDEPWTVNQPWNDQDDFRTTEWMHRFGIKASVEIIGKAVQAVARERHFHPVLEYLGGLRWDGTPRLDEWLMTYANASTEEGRADYIKAIGSKWMISAVARIYDPGCKVDHMLILRSPQGDGKSTAFRILFSPWFTDCLSDMKSKDASQETFGVWCIEISEMASWNKSDSDVAKSYITRQTDRFRPPYGKHTIDQPRQCVFAGSINPEIKGFLKDPTGNRRYWIAENGRIDLEGLGRDRDQLWAEAVHRYKVGERWWLEDKELIAKATAEQDAHFQDDAWTEPVLEWLEQGAIGDDGKPLTADNNNGPSMSTVLVSGEKLKNSETRFLVGDVLQKVFGIEKAKWNAIDQARISRILTKHGYVLKRTEKGRFYQKVKQ